MNKIKEEKLIKILVESTLKLILIIFKFLYALIIIGTIFGSMAITYISIDFCIFKSECLLIKSRDIVVWGLLSLMLIAFFEMACAFGKRNENKVICLPDLRENKE
ncbi:TPA: hypothetical protein NKU24_004537 [Vibrio parahaemolyticus]|nr:hypothetical protein [Vibrio parahaemolyticus]HCH5272795.1 hypothetical protein [Vibrio parahaemolyticus]